MVGCDLLTGPELFISHQRVQSTEYLSHVDL